MTPQKFHNPYYCCYRIQAEKRIARGETLNIGLEKCSKGCNGYNLNCENYTCFKEKK